MKMNSAKFGWNWLSVGRGKKYKKFTDGQWWLEETNVDLGFRWAKNAAQIGITSIATPFGQTFQGGKKWIMQKSNKTSPSYRP